MCWKMPATWSRLEPGPGSQGRPLQCCTPSRLVAPAWTLLLAYHLMGTPTPAHACSGHMPIRLLCSQQDLRNIVAPIVAAMSLESTVHARAAAPPRQRDELACALAIPAVAHTAQDRHASQQKRCALGRDPVAEHCAPRLQDRRQHSGWHTFKANAKDVEVFQQQILGTMWGLHTHYTRNEAAKLHNSSLSVMTEQALTTSCAAAVTITVRRPQYPQPLLCEHPPTQISGTRLVACRKQAPNVAASAVTQLGVASARLYRQKRAQNLHKSCVMARAILVISPSLAWIYWTRLESLLALCSAGQSDRYSERRHVGHKGTAAAACAASAGGLFPEAALQAAARVLGCR
jgi:hypothetical protein